MTIRHWANRWKRTLEYLGVPGVRVVEGDGIRVQHPLGIATVIAGENLSSQDLLREVEALPPETSHTSRGTRYVAARDTDGRWLVMMEPLAFKRLLDSHLFHSFFTISPDSAARLMGELDGTMREEDGALHIEAALPTGHMLVLMGDNEELVMAGGSVMRRILGVTPEFFEHVKQAFLEGREAANGKE